MLPDELTKALEEMPFSIAISLNVIAILKEDMMNCGFRSFPIVAYTGKPGSGKTAIARACLANPELEFKFHRRGKVAEVQDVAYEFLEELILLDDFARYRSAYQRDKAARYMDLLVRDSFEGRCALLVITAEQAAVENISEACIDRMILLPIHEFWKDSELKKTLTFLQGTSAVKDYVENFREWYWQLENQHQYISKRLREWRSKESTNTARTEEVVFACEIAMDYIERYVMERHSTKLDKEKIRRNCEYLLEQRRAEAEKEIDLLKSLLGSIYQKQLLKISKPLLYEVCERYCQLNCLEACRRCFAEGNNTNCNYHYMPQYREYYLPQNILLPDEVDGAVLVEKPSSLFQFPRHIVDKPILVVRDNVLLSLVNSELEKYCEDNGVHIPRFSATKLHKLLYEYNFCLYRCEAKSHICYNFGYLNCSLQNENVVFLRLTETQYSVLDESSEPTDISCSYGFDNFNISQIISKWKSVFGNMFALAGEIGKREEDE